MAFNGGRHRWQGSGWFHRLDGNCAGHDGQTNRLMRYTWGRYYSSRKKGTTIDDCEHDTKEEASPEEEGEPGKLSNLLFTYWTHAGCQLSPLARIHSCSPYSTILSSFLDYARQECPGEALVTWTC